MNLGPRTSKHKPSNASKWCKTKSEWLIASNTSYCSIFQSVSYIHSAIQTVTLSNCTHQASKRRIIVIVIISLNHIIHSTLPTTLLTFTFMDVSQVWTIKHNKIWPYSFSCHVFFTIQLIVFRYTLLYG